jgi:hypothetical protein
MNKPVTYSKPAALLVSEMDKILRPHRSNPAYKKLVQQLSGKSTGQSGSNAGKLRPNNRGKSSRS